MSIQVNEQTIDWHKWLSLEIKDPALFRDNLLEQKMYSKRFDTFVNGIYSVTDGFSNYKNEKKYGGYIAAGHQRLNDVLNLMSLQYSAGGSLEFLKEIYPYLLHW